MGRHVMEALGRTRVVIEDGKVVEVGEPEVRYCPLFFKVRGITEITPEIVRQNIEFRIKDFGMCTPGRKMRMRDFLSFGISELLGMALSKGMLDAAVVVCEGAGTVVVSDPDLVQGIGGRVSGIVETSPIPEVVEAIGQDRVVDPESATIDMVKGAELAFRLGFRRVAVTVARAEDAVEVRRRYGQRVALFAVHTSGLSHQDAQLMFDNCDVVTACASKHVREVAKTRALLQVGNKVPVYASSLWGELLLRTRLEALKSPNVTSPEEPPVPLI
mgnify:CR=1 FL=1